MAQNDTATGVAQTYNLEVDPDTIIRGLKINDRPGVSRTVLFRPKVGGYGEGKLRDLSGVHWDGEAPPQLSPEAFVEDTMGGLAEARRVARSEAEREGENPDEWAEEAAGVWESEMRHSLKEEIVADPAFVEDTKTVYNIDYVDH